MKVALVHELLTMRGGAERVLRILANLFPEAPIYTLLYDEKKLGNWFPKERVRPSGLQRFAIFSTNHHLYLKHFPAAAETWDFSEFDLVISSSSAFAHGIITNGKPKHLCYVHSPARYLWDRTHDVTERASHGIFGNLRRRYLEKTFHELRIWDAETSARPDMLLAASKEIQRRIELYWRRESTVLHPPIDDFWLKNSKPYKLQATSYFLVVSSLVQYKRIDLAIEACNRLGLHLKIVGEGPDEGRLRKLAGPTIEFYEWREGDELADLYANAKATIFPGEEDFGLVPLESMACGTPVLAFRVGGALETIEDGKTGLFFNEPTSESLMEILKTFDRSHFDADECRETATHYSAERFKKGLLEAIGTLMES